MQKRKLGREGLEVSAWAGVHGDVGVLRRPRRAGVDRDDSSRAGSGSRFPRHRGHVRAVHERGTGRARIRAAATRSCWRPSSATCAARTAVPRRQRPARVRRRGLRGIPAPPRASRPSTSTTSTASTPTRPSRRRSARWRGSSSRERSGTSVCRKPASRRSGARKRFTRSRRFRPSTRCGAATRKTASSTCAASSASASSPTARSGAAFSPADQELRRPGAGRLPPQRPRFQGENFEKNLELVERNRGDRGGEGLHAGATRPGVGAGAGGGHRADPGHKAAQVSGRERRARSKSR